jgi:predicted component of type VI protein secretion system
VDHINDRRYYTYAPLSLEVKADYFTSGVKLHASFDSVDEEREVSIDLAAPHLGSNEPADIELEVSGPSTKLSALFEISGNVQEKTFDMNAGDRLTVGRTKENDLPLDDASVSKMHASLSLRQSGELVVADTGSTNGTFINGERIPYGKAATVNSGQELRFGSVNVSVSILEYTPAEPVQPHESAVPDTEESIKVGEFEFTTRHGDDSSKLKPETKVVEEPEPTVIGPTAAASRILTPLTNDPAGSAPKNGHETVKLEDKDIK